MKLLRIVIASAVASSIATTAAAEETSAPDACTTLIERAAREERDGKLVAARSHLGECRAEICTPEQRAECARRGDEIARAVPTVAFTVRDAAGHDLDGRVTLDDAEARIPLGRAVPIDPGVHEVRWSVPTGAWGTQRITVVEGEKLRLVSIVVPPPGGGSSSAAPWILVGAGATLLVTSAVFQLVAINEDSDSKSLELSATRSDLSPAESRALMASAQSHHDAAKTDQSIAIATGIVGVGAVATGLTWAVFRDRGTTSTMGLRPAAGPTFAGLAFGRSF